jgi:hypothetical protein
MRRFLLEAAFSLLLVLCFSSSGFASGIREIRVNRRPPGVPSNIVRWAYTNSGTVITRDADGFDRRVSGSVVYVYDPNAPASDTSILPTRGGRIDKPDGSTAPRPKTRDESAARGLACAAAAASLSSCKGEKRGVSPRYPWRRESAGLLVAGNASNCFRRRNRPHHGRCRTDREGCGDGCSSQAHRKGCETSR